MVEEVHHHHVMMVKPSRSDEILDPDKQIQITNQIRAQFESMEPKRPTKPNRSESEDTASASATTPPPASNHQKEDLSIPEMHKLKSLNSSQQATVFSDGLAAVQEEFVETGYYKNLDCVDKQHHTTGSGFIKVASESREDYDLKLRGDNRGRDEEMVFKSNPATNEWIPKIDDNKVEYVSSKPNRSESS